MKGKGIYFFIMNVLFLCDLCAIAALILGIVNQQLPLPLLISYAYTGLGSLSLPLWSIWFKFLKHPVTFFGETIHTWHRIILALYPYFFCIFCMGLFFGLFYLYLLSRVNWPLLPLFFCWRWTTTFFVKASQLYCKKQQDCFDLSYLGFKKKK